MSGVRTIFCLGFTMAIIGAAATAGAQDKFSGDRLKARFEQATQADPAAADAVAPDLEAQSQKINGVIEKYKGKAADTLPELQADLNGIKKDFTNSVAGKLKDGSLNAKVGDFQKGLMADVQDTAVDALAGNLFDVMKLTADQRTKALPIVKGQLLALGGVLTKAQDSKIEDIPTLLKMIDEQRGKFDAQLSPILDKTQMAELQKVRLSIDDKLFANLDSTQIDEAFKAVSGALSNKDVIKDILMKDLALKRKAVEATAGVVKDKAADQLRSKFDVINVDTAAKLKRVATPETADALETQTKEQDGKLLRAVARTGVRKSVLP